jgi:hypothetical protein
MRVAYTLSEILANCGFAHGVIFQVAITDSVVGPLTGGFFVSSITVWGSFAVGVSARRASGVSPEAVFTSDSCERSFGRVLVSGGVFAFSEALGGDFAIGTGGGLTAVSLGPEIVTGGLVVAFVINSWISGSP